MARLHGTRYVGRALVGGATLNLVEKVPGSLAALLSYASGGSFRVPPAQAAATPAGDLIGLLVHAFLERLREYVSHGIDFTYADEHEVGSLVGGRLDIAGTIRVRARGLRHMAAFTRPVIRRDLPKNKIALAALRQVERLAGQATIAPEDLGSARVLAHFFDDAHDVQVLLGRPEHWAERARELEANSASEAERDLLALAAVVLLHESFERDLASHGQVPRAWFVNLERLFETAVRDAFIEISGSSLSTTGAGFVKPPVFDSVGDRFRADPDLVVRHHGAAVAVGDAKYKAWNGFGTLNLHHDLYQLLVHTAAHGAGVAFLLYAHDVLDDRYLGMSATGADTWAFAVDVRDLHTDLTRVLIRLSLP